MLSLWCSKKEFMTDSQLPCCSRDRSGYLCPSSMAPPLISRAFPTPSPALRRKGYQGRSPWLVSSVLILNVPMPSQAQIARDPGTRAGSPGAGQPLGGLTGPQINLFNAGIAEFNKRDEVKADGLGPRMNLDSCAGCHAHPDVGGTSPPDLNPQFDFYERNLQKTNRLPRFITKAGPIREARFKLNPDGRTPHVGVHSIFTITGLKDADC